MTKDFLFAQRTSWEMTTNRLISTLDGLKLENQAILDLTESNPTRCRFRYPQNRILKPLADKRNLIYKPSPQGHRDAREAIARDYQGKGFYIHTQNLFLTSSTSEGYSCLLRLLLNPGDQAIFPRPSYPLFQYLLDLNDIVYATYDLYYDPQVYRWKIDFNTLKNAITQRTKAIILVNPNNPTGSFITQEELKALNNLCQNRNIALICDEVFADYIFLKNDQRVSSLMENGEALTFVLGGISKSLGLPQMKLGWIAVSGPPAIVEGAVNRLEIILDTYLSVSTPTQNALIFWLSMREVIQKEIQTRLKENQLFILSHISSMRGCQYLQPEGGWYGVIRLPDSVEEEEFVLSLLREDQVFVHPGYFFDFKEGAHIILSLLPTFDIFKEGFWRIKRRLAED